MIPLRCAALALFALTCSALPTLAQDGGSMTAEEIQNAFEKQKTRGLVVVPTTGANAADAEPAGETEVTTTGYQPVDPGDQVNVRISFDFDSAALREDQKPQLS